MTASTPTLLCAMTCLAWNCSADPFGEWLNVREFGASGSEYSTSAKTTDGSAQIVVSDPGDLAVGHGVMLSECHPRITKQQLWGPRGKVAWGRNLDGKAELRGYDGSQGDWLVLILDVGKGTRDFRWSEDMARTWHETAPITGDWQPVRDGMEVRFNDFEWEQGYTVVFGCRGQLVTTIEKIEGKNITLKDAPTRSVAEAVIRHCDDVALQKAIDEALKTKRNLYIPNGRYRLAHGLRVGKPDGITIQGENAVHTVFDISEGEGACIRFAYGREATLRNITMVGHSGFEKRDQCGHIPMKGSSYFWGFGAKNCNATTVSGTERMLIENCHGRQMASECFVGSCRGREAIPSGQTCSTSLTYLRCSAIDCGRNAFNDVTCGPENTSVLQCRIVDVGGCAWEGASRFVKFVGNYVRNAGTVAMGNLGTYNRDASFPKLGAGQHIVSDNVFESNVPYGGCAIRSAVGSTQVIITNNLFVNFGSSAVEASGRSDPTHYASANTTIRGNIFDMTEVGEQSRSRIAVNISASDAIVSDNQIYVRGECDANVTAVRIQEPAVNLTIHDNLIRNCGAGLSTGRYASAVGDVIDSKTFAPSVATMPLDHRLAGQCEGWRVVWLAGGRPTSQSIIEAIEGAAKPEDVRVRLMEDCTFKAGAVFEVIPPSANWLIHDNTITGCLNPVQLERYGGPTSIFRDNVVSRGATAGVSRAISIGGEFHVSGNNIQGFDEAGSAAIELSPVPLEATGAPTFSRNVIENCATVVRETHQGLWEASRKSGNTYIHCGTVPKQAAAAPAETPVQAAVVEAPEKAEFRAIRQGTPIAVDGDLSEWSWDDTSFVALIQASPAGTPVLSPRGRARAGFDDEALYLAIDFELPKGAEMKIDPAFGEGDGVEISFRDADPKTSMPIFVLWGSAGGVHTGSTAMGASDEQVEKLRLGVSYAAKKTPTGWACEWRIPFQSAGMTFAATQALLFNIGAHCTANDAWIGWAPAGGRFCNVDLAGTLRLSGK